MNLSELNEDEISKELFAFYYAAAINYSIEMLLNEYIIRDDNSIRSAILQLLKKKGFNLDNLIFL